LAPDFPQTERTARPSVLLIMPRPSQGHFSDRSWLVRVLGWIRELPGEWLLRRLPCLGLGRLDDGAKSWKIIT